ncbi:MAG: aconitase family protein [Bdellovibrionales bacterium]
MLLNPDRVAMQDATAQMALLQFMLAGKEEGGTSTVHCDHLIRAHEGMTEDMKVAMAENDEVFDFWKVYRVAMELDSGSPAQELFTKWY